MNITTILGIAMGAAFVMITMLLAGSPMLFVSAPSVMITVGGTLSSIITSYTWKEVMNIINVLKKTLSISEESAQEIISLLVKFAERARREGILALEKQMEEVTDVFLKNGIQLAVDGTEPELLKDIMETELFYLEERHKKGHSQIEAFATLAPAWGMIGTLIGLILMLANLSDPDALGPGMAVALITTFYGSIMANMIFTPLQTKLKEQTKEELLMRQLMIQGILSIQSGDNPRIVEQKLNSFIAPGDRVMKEE
ncbi:MotA/TolQ/ExbB proton channel family protein [candidate division KSB1 bacterium]|nr:MotA/TolQ/ExbB proton channel family protein [candidate division KSB1 bacterium]